MNDTEWLKVLLDGSPLLLLMLPSLITGLVLIFLLYLLVKAFGKEFITGMRAQTEAFNNIASSVQSMEKTNIESARLNDDIRITLMAMSNKIDQVLENSRKRGDQ